MGRGWEGALNIMDKFESSIREVPYSQHAVYSMLENMENIERVRDRIPADKVGQISFDRDTITVSGSPIGSLSMKIIDREPEKLIKMTSVDGPVAFNVWIQVLPLTDASSKMKVTLGAELNMFIRQMAGRKIQEAVEKLAGMLQYIKYE